MSLVIRNIDSAHKRVTVALSAEAAGPDLKQLPAFVMRCEKLGYVVDFVRELDPDPGEFHVEHAADRTALDFLTDFVLICCAATGLDALVASRLRLAVYELTINSIEHATFDSTPTLRLTLRAAGRGISVCYEDNATSFETVSNLQLKIEEKISRGDKRGLGLFLLAKMAHELAWERIGSWNRTSFRLVGQDALTLTSRRSRMKEFEVHIKPVNAKGVTIVRPVGSIDSNTTPTLEGHIESLIEAGQYRIVADLSEAEFISSAGIGIFLGSVGRLRALGGDLYLMTVAPAVQDVFDLLNIADYFRSVSSIEELEPSAKV